MIQIIPAIDIINGECVRLQEGRFDAIKKYGDPLQAAIMFKNSGFNYLHIVDLDGARKGEIENINIIHNIISSTKLNVQVGGGINSVLIAEKLLDMGAKKIIIGSKSVTDINFLKELVRNIGIDKIILAADIINMCITVNAWQNVSQINIYEYLNKTSNLGFREYICTDISADGMLQGPAIKLYSSITRHFPQVNITASGGVGSIDDIQQLEGIGVKKVIVGKAFYEKKIPLTQKNGGANAC